MSKPNPLQPLSRVLAADARLAAWSARHQQEHALTLLVRRSLPRPVAERVWVADAAAGTLELATASGAIAATLRQRGPDLLASLQREGWEFTVIRVRVQPQRDGKRTEKTLPPQWDSTAKQALSALEAGLPPGPLKASLGKLLRGR